MKAVAVVSVLAVVVALVSVVILVPQRRRREGFVNSGVPLGGTNPKSVTLDDRAVATFRKFVDKYKSKSKALKEKTKSVVKGLVNGGEEAVTGTEEEEEEEEEAGTGTGTVGTITTTEITSRSVKLSWSGFVLEPAVTKYLIYPLQSSGGLALEESGNEITITNLDPGQQYTYNVNAQNNNGGSVSTTVDFTTENAKIATFGVNPPNTSPYGAVISLNNVPTDYTDSRITITYPINDGVDLIEHLNHTTVFSGLDPLTEYTVEATLLSDTEQSVPIETTFTTQELTRYVLDNDGSSGNIITINKKLTGKVYFEFKTNHFNLNSNSLQGYDFGLNEDDSTFVDRQNFNAYYSQLNQATKDQLEDVRTEITFSVAIDYDKGLAYGINGDYGNLSPPDSFHTLQASIQGKHFFRIKFADINTLPIFVQEPYTNIPDGYSPVYVSNTPLYKRDDITIMDGGTEFNKQYPHTPTDTLLIQHTVSADETFRMDIDLSGHGTVSFDSDTGSRGPAYTNSSVSDKTLSLEITSVNSSRDDFVYVVYDDYEVKDYSYTEGLQRYKPRINTQTGSVQGIRLFSSKAPDSFQVSRTDPQGANSRRSRSSSSKVSARVYRGLAVTEEVKAEIETLFGMRVNVDEEASGSGSARGGKTTMAYDQYLLRYNTPLVALKGSGERADLNFFVAVAAGEGYEYADANLDVLRANLQNAADIVFHKLKGFEGFPPTVAVNIFGLAINKGVVYTGAHTPIVYASQKALADASETCYFGNGGDCSATRTDGLKHHHHLVVWSPIAPSGKAAADHTLVYSTVYPTTTLTDYIKIVVAMTGAVFMCARPDVFDPASSPAFLKASCTNAMGPNGEVHVPLSDMDYAILRQVWLFASE